jgi:acetate kinase
MQMPFHESSHRLLHSQQLAFRIAHGPRISTAGSRISAWVIPTDEELMIARHTLALTGAATA